MRLLAGAAALALAATWPQIASAQSADVHRMLEDAGRAFEGGSRMDGAGDHQSAIVRYREVLALVDRAAAMAPPTPQITFGRQEIMFSLGAA